MYVWSAARSVRGKHFLSSLHPTSSEKHAVSSQICGSGSGGTVKISSGVASFGFPSDWTSQTALLQTARYIAQNSPNDIRWFSTSLVENFASHSMTGLRNAAGKFTRSTSQWRKPSASVWAPSESTL
jgi:hypothetical protein